MLRNLFFKRHKGNEKVFSKMIVDFKINDVVELKIHTGWRGFQTVIGRIDYIDNDSLTVDISNKFQSKELTVSFENIIEAFIYDEKRIKEMGANNSRYDGNEHKEQNQIEFNGHTFSKWDEVHVVFYRTWSKGDYYTTIVSGKIRKIKGMGTHYAEIEISYDQKHTEIKGVCEIPVHSIIEIRRQ